MNLCVGLEAISFLGDLTRLDVVHGFTKRLVLFLSKTAVHSLSRSRRKDYQNQFDAFQARMGRRERDGLIFP